MKRQAEFDELSRLTPAFDVDRDLLEQQKQLGLFKPGDRVRYKGDVGEVSAVSVFKEELRYTVLRINKNGWTSSKKLVWYAVEEDLDLVKVANRH